MKKIVFIIIAIMATSLAFSQNVVIKELKVSEKDSTWTTSEKKLWDKYSVANPYGKLVKFTDIKPEDLGTIYHITGITKSSKMIKDSVGLKAEYPDQWMITYKSKGKIIAYVSYDNPLKEGKSISDVIGLMGAGLHQGDDETTDLETKSDIELAPSADENVAICDEF